MKRDWDIIRDILLALERSPRPQALVTAESLAEHDEQAVAYNMLLLVDGGYAEGRFIHSSLGDGHIAAATLIRLTNAGHDLLHAVRQQSVWEKIKTKFAENSLDMSAELVIKVGKSIIESMLS